jgi:hypothetical protein
MRWVHIAIRRTNAGRTRRRLLGGHGEGSAHVSAQIFVSVDVRSRGSGQMMAGALVKVESMKY